MLSRAEIDELFNHESFFVGDEDVVTVEYAEKIFGKNAVKYAIRQHNSSQKIYMRGKEFFRFIERYGFLIAADFINSKNFEKQTTRKNKKIMSMHSEKLLNENQIKELFKKESVFLYMKDVVLYERAETIFGKEAVEYVINASNPGGLWSYFWHGDNRIVSFTLAGLKQVSSYYSVEHVLKLREKEKQKQCEE
ncbi:hypothetical protein Q5O24_00620 [Eubacteriaceae bacterium ES3]|nr:hypothetical protein Q5O24_00620 [Eubacteriaceae bacterium ES3]